MSVLCQLHWVQGRRSWFVEAVIDCRVLGGRSGHVGREQNGKSYTSSGMGCGYVPSLEETGALLDRIS